MNWFKMNDFKCIFFFQIQKEVLRIPINYYINLFNRIHRNTNIKKINLKKRKTYLEIKLVLKYLEKRVNLHVIHIERSMTFFTCSYERVYDIRRHFERTSKSPEIFFYFKDIKN